MPVCSATARQLRRFVAGRCLDTVSSQTGVLCPGAGLAWGCSSHAGPLTLDIDLILNGQRVRLDIAPDQRLSSALRANGLTGAKEGCLEGECGACTILLDDRPVCSCLMLAAQADGHRIETIEGIGSAAAPSDLQRAFVETGAVQCGYCTPGMILAAEGLLRREPDPDEAEIRHAIAGNICRCTGYANIVTAVARTAKDRRATRQATP